MSYTYKYPRAAITVDIVLVNNTSTELQCLLIQRKHDPYKQLWAFPGGFLDMNETLLEAAKRELYEETGIENVDLYQFKTFDALDRDPRHRTLTIVFYGYLANENIKPNAADDASDARWWPIGKIPKLAFDHDQILHDVLLNINKLI